MSARLLPSAVRKLVLPWLALWLTLPGACSKKNEVTSLNCAENTLKCVECKPQELDCDGATLIECNPDGKGFSLKAECESTQLCAEGLATNECAEPTCSKGEASCVGSVMQICAAGRNKFELVACETEDACKRGLEDLRCAEAQCSLATDCAGQDTECRRRECFEGKCIIHNLDSLVACTLGGVNGMCDGKGGCLPSEECAKPGDCPGKDTECRIRVCVSGQCSFADLPKASACATAAVNGECDGEGSCIATDDCTIASDCPGADTDCRIRACVAGKCGFANLPEATVCTVSDVQGTCNGNGVCMAAVDCNLASQCPGNDTDCRQRSCTDGKCGFESMPLQTACTSDGRAGECNGAGSCTITQQCLNASECPGITTECQAPACSATGKCTTSLKGGSCSIGISQGQCVGGKCQCTGTLGTFCANECVSTATNVKHCGQCNKACTDPNEICSGSACTCKTNFKECAGTCEDMRLSAHCGNCNDQCPENSACKAQSSTCGGNGGPGCECNSGFKRCVNPNSQYYDKCIKDDATYVSENCKSGVGNALCATPI